jgi:hypothetical protein
MTRAKNAENHAASQSPPDRVPKVCGEDTELGNFITGVESGQTTGQAASRALLSRIPGLPKQTSYGGGCDCPTCREQRRKQPGLQSDHFESFSITQGYGYNPQDVSRRYLPRNGSCALIDLDHCELCLPEVISALDHVAAWHAMLKIAQQALTDVNEALEARPANRGKRLQALVNNTDGHGHSYGSHLNFMITRRAWDNLFHRKMHYLMHLATFQIAMQVLTGQGKVGSENGAPDVNFQISQRADFFETLVGTQTTFRRPIVNARDETLSGDRSSERRREERDEAANSQSETAPAGDRLARLHVIYFDNNLCHVPCFLKVGLMQIQAAMIEAEQIRCTHLLDDPVEAVVRFSHDPSLQTKALLTSGEERTAVDLLRFFLDDMTDFVERGGCEGFVPHAREIMELANDTVQKLAARDFDALLGRVEWLLKQQMLERTLAKHTHLNWQSPEIKHLDHLYSSLDPAEGLYWIYEQNKVVETLVTPGEIERFMHSPPDDTRAYARAMLLRKADAEQVRYVDWDRIHFRFDRPGSWQSRYRTLEMSDPLRFTRAQTEHIFQNPQADLEQMVEALGAVETESSFSVGASTMQQQLFYDSN